MYFYRLSKKDGYFYKSLRLIYSGLMKLIFNCQTKNYTCMKLKDLLIDALAVALGYVIGVIIVSQLPTKVGGGGGSWEESYGSDKS